MTDYPRVTIRNAGNRPTSDGCTIELDGQPLTSVTAIRVDVVAGELTKVTLTMLADVDVDTPAVVQRIDVEPPEIAEVARLAPLRPSDTLILETDEHWSRQQADEAEAYLKSRFPDNDVAVIVGGRLKASSELPVWRDITGEVDGIHAERGRRWERPPT